MNQVDDILLSSNDSHEVLRRLYSFQKQKQPTFSLTILGKKLGIASKGHISDMIRGRRSISRKHWSQLGQIFDLSETQTHYFLCLLEKDHSKSDDQRVFYQKQLDSLESLFQQSHETRTLPNRTDPTKFSGELLKAFPLFPNTPNLRDLVDYFGRHRLTEIESSLAYLVKEGFIRQTDNGFELSSKSSVDSSILSKGEYTQASILEAADFLPQFENHQNALFSTEVLCLERDHYAAPLKEFQQKINDYKLKQSHSRQSLMIKVNLQAYPLGLED